MGDHHHAVDAQQQRAAELPPVGPTSDGPQLGADEQTAQGGQRVAAYRVAHALEDKLGGALRRLDQDIAAEAVGHHDVRLPSENVLAFDVADEVDPRLGPQQGLGSLDELVALAGLLAIAELSHPRTRDAHQLLGVDTAHHRVLQQVLRLGVRVCADIEEEAVFPSGAGTDGASYCLRG